MITTKQRAKLRGLANSIQTTIQIGKSGITDAVATQASQELKARELIKLRVLESSGITAKQAAGELAQMTGADIVQCIGTRFVLFLQKDKDTAYPLDK